MTDDKKPIKSITDLLKMDGDDGFDMTKANNDLEKLEERRAILQDYKQKIKELEKLGNKDYKLHMLKQLVESGMSILQTIQKEIEDNPRGRDVECVSALMNSINSTIDGINKMDFFEEKMKLEKEKIEAKQKALLGNDHQGNNLTQNNYIFTTDEIVKMVQNPEQFSKTFNNSTSKPTPSTIDIESERVDD